ncbi:histidine phosphatase super family protein [Burkholderia ambifaria AMMD]|uniref:Multiple inositol polyphosphate phosphatase 1 n=1 Tax=Burkholderia ambifaria (strain ATCC BAA-244 / DSM 16087 / CCUG 44356 / LMG 19182 / AMMD) TaxID=339670 RepID=Q0B5D5_BURCM|nr:histidine-type phosphatase [Burkholderia ambifaria]ABI90638.1 histidine acid phosphatase [Burkholderia ambifaria AMMD]AJY25664.1 histidine phosphatase super family protein [Burkholderia ambifaria AMMD]MBR7933933.1 histidine-type phosphatase [Burkholderia ambifaria]PEH68663.1 histidine-type phosphatase [Burkholderia ambifaria]QQC06754.1 histidine-type phosphatase [Burkholderia ambifaria]
MTRPTRTASAIAVLCLLLAACGGETSSTPATSADNSGTQPAPQPPQPKPTPAPATYYQTKTPYRPQQDAATYEAPPAGYAPVYTELVARHGSRGLSGFKYDGAIYSMLVKAEADGALTALGAQLKADTYAMMKANALLGYGVPGISTPGYGNLTQTGIREHQQLAARLAQRLPALFASGGRQIVVVNSGQDRAVDSSTYFSAALVAAQPALAAAITLPAAPSGYPASAPIAQPAGTNRFLLYFHSLKPATDLVTDTSDPYYATYQASQAYQAYSSDAAVADKLKTIKAAPQVGEVAQTVLAALVSQAFIAKLGSDGYTFANTGTYAFTSSDGKFTNTLKGDGKTKIASAVDAVNVLYNLLQVAPAMTAETGGVTMEKYLGAEQAQTLAYLQDAEDYYQKGPGIQEANPVTYRMAKVLQDDFFNEVDAIARGDLTRAAKLRFTHAEIVIPFASIMNLKGVFVPTPQAQTYTYANNPWRGDQVSPMAANMQWDVYRNGSRLIVKMLYNERETDFQAACDGAKIAPASHYYDYAGLKRCYGYQ